MLFRSAGDNKTLYIVPNHAAVKYWRAVRTYVYAMTTLSTRLLGDQRDRHFAPKVSLRSEGVIIFAVEKQ
jgi:hypothetical protein